MKIILVKECYVSPKVKTIELFDEGLLCGSVPPGGSEDGEWGEDL